MEVNYLPLAYFSKTNAYRICDDLITAIGRGDDGFAHLVMENLDTIEDVRERASEYDARAIILDKTGMDLTREELFEVYP